MEIKNKYLAKAFESLSKFNDDNLSLSQPLHNFTLINIENDKLIFKHLTREILTKLDLNNAELTKITDSDREKVLVDTERITKLLREINVNETIKYEKGAGNVQFKTNKGKYVVSTIQEIEEFENLFSLPEKKHLLASVYLKDFIEIINDVKKVCVDNKPNTLMSLISFVFENEKLTIYTTDGYRVARSYTNFRNVDSTSKNDDPTIEGKFNIVGKLIKKYVDFLMDLRKITDDEIINIYKADNRIVFSTDSSISSMIISSLAFHDLSPHFNVNNNASFIVKAKDLKDDINRLNVFVRNSIELFIIKYSKEGLVLSSEETRFNTSGSENVDVQDFTGEKGVIRVTASHLKNSLERYYSNDVKMTINTPEKPFLLESEATPLMFVILPIAYP